MQAVPILDSNTIDECLNFPRWRPLPVAYTSGCAATASSEAWFGSHREPFKTPPARQAKGLEGRAILAVHRMGKHIVCELGPAGEIVHSHPSRKNKNAARVGHPGAGLKEVEDNSSAQWIVHLGMTGRLLVTTPDGPVAPHTHARLSLASGRELRFVDPRRFGRLEFRDLGRSAGFSAAGSGPLTIEAEEFAALFRGRQLAIKAALLNQTSAGRSGQHLRRREPLSRRHPAAQEGGTADQG